MVRSERIATEESLAPLINLHKLLNLRLLAVAAEIIAASSRIPPLPLPLSL